MAESLRQFTAQKLVLAAAGIVALASVSFGGWQLWSSRADPVDEARQQIVHPDSQPLACTPPGTLPVKNDELVAAVKPTPVRETPAVEDKEPAKQEAPRTKEPIQGKDHTRPNEMLTTMIQQFHQEAYQHFVNQPGFGFSRMMPTVQLVRREWKLPEWTSEELAKEQPAIQGEKDLTAIHGLALMRFGDSNAKTPSGLSKPGSKPPNPPAKKEMLWEIKSLDLVGLAMKDEPVVYVSDKLPEMADLRNRPTRAMDLFEWEGLEELMNGKQLYIRSKGETIRVLGPLHAGKACLKCHHDSKEGAMLGMFSYTLRAGQYQSNIRGQPPSGFGTGGAFDPSKFNPGIAPATPMPTRKK